MARSLGIGPEFIRFFKFLFVKLHVEFLEIPLSERSGVNAHDGVLHEGLCADKLVVRRIIDSIQNTSLARDCFRSPGEGTMIVLKSTLLVVATTSTDINDSFSANLGHGWHSAHFEFSLFLVNWHAATSGSPLVPGVPRNTHTS